METLSYLIRPFPDKMFNNIIQVTVFNFCLEQIRLQLHYVANMPDIYKADIYIFMRYFARLDSVNETLLLPNRTLITIF